MAKTFKKYLPYLLILFVFPELAIQVLSILAFLLYQQDFFYISFPNPQAVRLPFYIFSVIIALHRS